MLTRPARRQLIGFRPKFTGARPITTTAAASTSQHDNNTSESTSTSEIVKEEEESAEKTGHEMAAPVTATEESPKPMRKSQAELDDELRSKLEAISGEGGGAGIEYEGGKAVGLKRGVKENMFRVI